MSAKNAEQAVLKDEGSVRAITVPPIVSSWTSYLPQLAGALAIGILSIVVFAPPLLTEATSGYDYFIHLRLAQDMAMTGSIPAPHFLYHLFLAGLLVAFPEVPAADLGVLVGVFAYALLGVSLYALLWKALKHIVGRKMSILGAMGISMCLMLIGPMALITPNDLYLGYVSPNAYHNPTMTLLRPIALLLFLLSTRIYSGAQPNILVWAVAGPIVAGTATLAKPNFTMCLLPAIGVGTLVALITHKSVSWRLLLGIGATAAAVLVWQYAFTYFQATPGSIAPGGIIFAPLKVYLLYTSDPVTKLLLSILFPLSVLALYHKAAVRSMQLMFSWLLFAFGIAQAYLFAESGPRLYDGNFTWSAEITLFILFVTSTLFLLRQLREPRSVRGLADLPILLRVAPLLCSAAFVLHLASGLFWYIETIKAPFIDVRSVLG